jgi:acyl carrier protein
MKTTTNEFIIAFAETIEREAATINVSDCFRDYEEWDSIALLSLVAMLDDNYAVNIPRDIFEKLETIQDLIDQVNNS